MLISLLNIFKRKKIIIIPENKDWVINVIAKKIKFELKKQNINSISISNSPLFFKNKIIHFGSINSFKSEINKTDPSNKIIVSWFHVNQGQISKTDALNLNSKIDLIHTASTSTKKDIIDLGFSENKIIIIPLGIDDKIFKPLSSIAKDKIRRKLNIPKNKIIIGSFQKDGNGWQEGNEPKLIKGPDIFCDVVEKLSQKYPIHILLTGPARGYVKNRLTKANIPFTHKYLKNYNDIVNYYHALDLYLITSRLEGGPMAILESWATGVPLISTKVGMVEDISENNIDILLSEIDNINDTSSKASKIIENPEFSKTLTQKGLEKVKAYTWSKIAPKYYEELYKKFI